MESEHGRMNEGASSHIPHSNNSYFTEQARRAGYVGPDSSRSQCEHFRDHHHHHHHHLLHHNLHTQPYPRPFLHPATHPHDMNEAMQREIEKEQIREEIIMSEIARRRVLEAEVRRELMMERELALRRGAGGFLSPSSSVMGFDLPMNLPVSGTRLEGRSLEERMELSLEDRERLSERHESGGFAIAPFQRETAGLKISEVKPVLEGGKEKQKIILLAKPNENISGSKRKAATPPPKVVASERPNDSISIKKAKEEWSCAICQVSTTCEQGLKEHLRGRKHKSKESALKSQRTGKSYSIGLFPKKATKSGPVVVTDDLPFLEQNKNLDDSKKKQSLVTQKVQKSDTTENYRFWCEMCQVGVTSNKVMKAHKKGKKHVSRLLRIDLNGEASRTGQKEKNIVQVVNHEGVVEDGKSIEMENVDEAVDKSKLEDHGAVEEVKAEEDHEAVDEIKPEEDHEDVDEVEPEEDDEAVDEVEPDEDHEDVDEVEPEEDHNAEDGGDVNIGKVEDDLTNDVVETKDEETVLS